MQKTAYLLCAALLVAWLAACGAGAPAEPEAEAQSETGEVLVVCVDDSFGVVSTTVLDRFIGANPELTVEVQVVPSGWESELEREAFLTGLRAEMLAGKGPDMLCMSASQNNGGSLFADENKGMATGMLADLADWLQPETLDSLQPALLEAGRHNGVQYIVPLDYGLNHLIFSDKSIAVADSVLGDAHTVYDFAKRLPALYETFEEPWRVMLDVSLIIQSSMIDYGAMTVALDHEGLAAVLEANKYSLAHHEEWQPANRYAIGDKESALVPAAEGYINSNGFDPTWMVFVSDAYRHVERTPALYFLPNETGGHTAAILNYAAIPANSQNKAAAASFIELLLAEEYQKTVMGKYERMGWSHFLPARMGCLLPMYQELGYKGDALWELPGVEQAIDSACFVPYDFRGIVNEQLERFYQEEITAQEALLEIERRLKLYF